MRDETFILGLTIISLLLLESLALFLGYNGAFFFPVIVIIAGLGGYEIKDWLKNNLKK